MSYSIVKKSLLLMNNDLQCVDAAVSSKKQKTKNAMKLIKTNRKGVWKELRKLHRNEQQTIRNKFSKPNFKSSIEKIKEGKNNELSTMVSCDITPDKKLVNRKKVLQYHMQHFTKRKEEIPVEEEKTVFTDRDFDKFEEEYDFFAS